MKKYIFLIILIFICSVLQAQKFCRQKNTIGRPNTISLVLELTNYYGGLRYDYQYNNYGFYGLVNIGRYYTFEESSYTRKHIKSSVGIVRYFINYADPRSMSAIFGMGLNYHWYENIMTMSSELKSFSADINVGIRIKRFMVCILYDPFKTERGITVGYKF